MKRYKSVARSDPNNADLIIDTRTKETKEKLKVINQ